MKINKIEINTLNTAKDIEQQKVINTNNELVITKANISSIFLDKVRDISSDFVIADSLEEDNEITVVYKQWDINIYTDTNLEDQLDFILPFINYKIILLKLEKPSISKKITEFKEN